MAWRVHTCPIRVRPPRHPYTNAAFNLIPAGETYQSRTLQLPAPLRFASVTFLDAELRGLMQPGADVALHMRPKLVVEDGRVDLLVRLLAKAGRAADPDDAVVRSHVLLALAAVVLGPASAGPASGKGALDAKRLALARAYVESRMQMDTPLAGMAAANLSAFHSVRAFKQATGLSPAAYARQRRTERARALLRSTNLPLAEVGRLVGYADPARFSHRFKAEVGLSPSAYRRR